jgi:hypothetical protein
MFTVFKNYINEKISISEKDWLMIEQAGVVKKLRKHQYLDEIGYVKPAKEDIEETPKQ